MIFSYHVLRPMIAFLIVVTMFAPHSYIAAQIDPSATPVTAETPVSETTAAQDQTSAETPSADPVGPGSSTDTPVVEVAEAASQSDVDAVISETDASVMVQDTATSQESAPAETLEAPVDPTTASSTESEVIVVVEEVATSTEETATSTAMIAPVQLPVVPDEQPAPESIEIAIDEQQELQIVAAELTVSQEVVEQEVATRTRLEPDVEPSYVFALSGKKIPTKLSPGKAAPDQVNATIDPTSNTVHVSGSCADVYFVVLLYRNAGDYETDPASYIVNRAYPCENGSYSYSINDMPATIANGTYYLLIGEQGNKGSWRAASVLTEIVINRSN